MINIFKILIMYFTTSFILFASLSLAQVNKDLQEDFGNSLESNVFDDLAHNPFMKSPQIILSHGYPAEVHEVATADGFILEVHRIPRSIRNPISHRQLPVVLIAPGLAVNSADFIINGPNSSLAYSLSNSGYDVWIVNFRGTKYSGKHFFLSNDSRDYWDFSFHEMAMFDIPATIDYILATTKEFQLDYIGYSMGTTIFFILMSEKPQYTTKIRKMAAICPAVYDVYPNPLSSPFLTLFNNNIELWNILGVMKFFDPELNVNRQLSNMCSPTNVLTYPFCNVAYIMFAGQTDPNVDMTKAYIYFAHYPDSASVKAVTHYNQILLSGKFRQFDYGLYENLRRYGKTEPPSYDLNKSTIPISMYYSDADRLTRKNGVIQLSKELPNVVLMYNVPFPNLSHQGFLIAKNSKMAYHDVLLDFLWNGNVPHSADF